MASSKFSHFNLKDVTYKTVKCHAIETTILVPKNAGSEPRPVLVHFHGGFLVVGDKMFEDWWAPWLAQFVESVGAIVVSPNYRLLPEATGAEIMEDISDFWAWMQTSLQAEVTKLAPNMEADLSKIAVAGESAGGYLAVQSALLFPDANIKAVISQYGMLDNAHPHFTKAGVKNMNNAPPQPEAVVNDYLKSLKPGSIRSSSGPEDLWLFIVATIQYGRYLEFLGTEDRLFPIKNLETAKSVPPMWIIHGQDDSLVPSAVSDDFVNKFKELQLQTPVFYKPQPGEHGFDSAVNLDAGWAKEGCAWVEKFWLSA